MPKVAGGFYAVCKGREIGVFDSWDEAESHVRGYPGAKFKKFKARHEADNWYRTNLPRSPKRKTATATTSTLPLSPSSVTRTLSTPPRNTASRPTPKYRPVATATPGPAQTPRIAAPKNTTVDIVYSDGACKGNGGPHPIAGIGVWWGPNDPRNISERCPGAQTNNRAELIAIARVLETVPPSTNTLIIRTDSQYSQNTLTDWPLKWRKNGWVNAAGKPVVNKQLIDYILTLLETRQRSGQPVRLEYVKGHSGDTGNDGADALAVAGCSHPEISEKDWVRLKEAYYLNKAEQDVMAEFADIDPADFFLNDADLMRELEEGI